MGAGLGFTVVHAVFTSKGLNELLQSHVSADVVGDADGGLNAEEDSGEGRVEGLEVVGELCHDWAELGFPV